MTLADDDNNSIIADYANRAQCGHGDHQGSRQGGGTGVARNIRAGVLVSCHHVDDNICCWNIGR